MPLIDILISVVTLSLVLGCTVAIWWHGTDVLFEGEKAVSREFALSADDLEDFEWKSE